jgi:nitrogen fixation/metabolism regulation signal transduction histidine kinase
LPNLLPHDRQIPLLAWLAGAPAVAVAFWLLWTAELAAPIRWTLSLVIMVVWIGLVVVCHQRLVRPLATLSNLLSALREGDFSIQAHGARRGDPLGDVLTELNDLIASLREQRLGALEAGALLRTVMEEINVAIFTFDDRQQLRLANRAGERLLAQPVERLLGRTASQLGLAECLEGEPVRTLDAVFPGGLGRWGLRRSHFRQDGQPHQLLVLTDLSQALREEERQAWQRLVRVLGHEMNNSLAPIKSIATSLNQIFSRQPLPEDWKEDAQSGLGVIISRTESLNRFMEAYARLARLPPPKKRPVSVAALVRRTASLETDLTLKGMEGPDLTINADRDQLEQVLINLLHNAADATRETGGKVRVAWSKAGGFVEIRIEDEGPGLANTANLFVPFFTTKAKGTGIGLTLSRQIAEAHGGSLTLENRKDRPGCIATLRLPRD